MCKLAVTIGDGPIYLFNLKAPARPKIYSCEGDWQKPDGIEAQPAARARGWRSRWRCSAPHAYSRAPRFVTLL